MGETKRKTPRSARSEKKTSVHIDLRIWDLVEKLADANEWPHKAIVAAALLAFCEYDTDTQWKAYRRLAEFRCDVLPD